jgi:hypothetical protein
MISENSMVFDCIQQSSRILNADLLIEINED